MAKIRNTDVAEKDVFANLRKSAEKSVEVLKEMERVLKENLTQQKNFAKGFKATNVSDIKKLATAQNEVKKSVAGLTQVQKQKLALEQRLAQANSQQQNQIQQLKLLTAEQIKNVKAEARAELERLGVIEKSAAAKRADAKASDIQNNAYKRLSAETNKAQAEFKRLAAQFGVNSTQAKNARVQFDKLDNKLRVVNEAARDGRRDVGRYGTAFSKLGGILKSGLGFIGLTAGIAGITRLIGNAVNIFKDFEAANSRLQSVLGATESEMERLKVQAKELGATTSFTASQVTELQTEFAKLGFPTKEILNMTESTLAAAAAMGSGLGEQAALTGATIKAFGLSSTDAARVNDVLAKSTSRSALDFSKLNASMSTIAPVASKLGFGLEDTVALLGNLSDSGFDASTAATATRNIMLKLADSSSVLGKRLKEPVRDLPSLIKGLKQLTNEGVDLSEALELTDVRSVAAFSTFLSGTESLEKLSAELNNAEGAAQKMADTMLDNLAGDITKAESAWEGFILSIESGDGRIARAMRNITQSFTQLLDNIQMDDRADELGITRALFQDFDEGQKSVFNLDNALKKFRKGLAETNAPAKSYRIAIKAINEQMKTLDRSTELGNARYIVLRENLIALGQEMSVSTRTIKENSETVVEETQRTVAVIEAEIEAQQKLIKEQTNRKGAKAIQDKIKLLEKEREAIIGSTNAKKDVFDIEKELEDARNRNIKNELDRQIQLIETEFKRRIDAVKGNGEKETQLRLELAKERNRKIDALVDEEIKRKEEEDKKLRDLRKAQGEYELELEKKNDEERQKQADKFEEEQAKRRAEIREKGLDVLSALEDKYFEDQNEKADKQISETEKREKRLQELADKGIQDARDSLAQNQKEQAEAVKKKEDLRQQEKKTELALAVLKAFNSELEKGADPSTAFAKAIASSAVLVSAISALPAFFDGTEDTGNNGKGVDGKGGFLSILHPNERVVPKVINDKLEGISNEKLGELADNGLLSYALNSQNMGVKYSEDSKITKELSKLQELNKSIIKAIESRPIDEGWTVDDIKKVATHTVRIGSKREKTKFKL